jgi:hypothetical protein
MTAPLPREPAKPLLPRRRGTRMRRWVSMGVLVPLLLAGCVQQAPQAPPPGVEAQAAAAPFYGEAVCANGLLFQLVDYAQTDPHLPPGFHPRDPNAFLNSPAAFGQAGVIFMVLDCESEQSGPLAAAFVGIFIEAPAVAGVEPAPFNFYELARYGSKGEFGGALGAAAWPLAEANVSVTNLAAALRPYDFQASAADAEGTIAMLWGTAMAPAGVIGPGPTRFWHQDTQGIAFIEYGAVLQTLVGTGACQARAGSPLAEFVGPPTVGHDLIGHYACPGPAGEPVVAVLEGLALNATFQRFPGVLAA